MLRGKTAVVTGSTQGIGLSIAEALAAQGCAVMLNGFGDAAEIEGRRRALAEKYGVDIGYHPADLLKPEQAEALIEATRLALGGVDILVNNAGIQHVAPVEHFPIERWQAVIGLNLSAAFYAIRAALPGMKARGWGRIVNIASAHGLVASVEKAAYVAAKHGLVGLTKVVALETAEQGITCNAVCPGWVLTALVERQVAARAQAENITFEAAALDLLKEKQPSMKFVTVEQIGRMVTFLCEEAAASITGAALPIDGGWTAR